jgi:hypothetical protein
MEYHYLRIPIPKRRWLWISFRIGSILLLVAIISILLAWRRDHDKLTAELRRMKHPNGNWTPSQATGAPNTAGPGDITTAWASASSDNQQEWLLLEFDKSVRPTAIVIHETYNPGAVIKVTHVPMWGTEKVIWEGTDPTPTNAGVGVSRLPVTERIRTGRIKVYIDSQNVAGFNEIDAVGLEYGDPKSPEIIWASEAEASSYWGESWNANSTALPTSYQRSGYMMNTF